MANTLLNTSKILDKSLMILENNLAFAGRANREYSDEFAQKGAKVGATVNVRKPVRFVGTTGPALNVENVVETVVPVTLDTQFHVDFTFSSQELTLNVDEFADRYLKPAMAASSRYGGSMTIIITFIVAHLTTFLTAGGALAAVVVAWFHGKSTGQTKAQDEAKAAIGAAQSQAATAQLQAAQSAADAEEAQKTVAAVQVAAQAQADAHAMTSDQLDAEAATLGILRKD